MNNFLESLVVLSIWAMLMSLVFLCAWMYPPLHEAKKVDCALAEFSPDISNEIKQLCREARSKK